MNKGGYVIIEDISYNPDAIFSSVPEELQDDHMSVTLVDMTID